VTGAAPILDARGLTIAFGPVVANEDVDLAVHAAEIHCVLGENGAGKSTLMKMLYGVYRPDSGTISVDGEPLELRSPIDARRAGLGMVFQDFRLVPALTVLENVALGWPSRGPRFPRRAVAARLAEVAAGLGLEVDVDTPVRQLPIAQRQQVEIAKALVAGARILILDEPTSVLAPQEAEGLFEQMEQLRADGLSVIIITHKIREARRVADRISVLRGGHSVVEGIATDSIADADLIEAMVGRAVPPLPSERVAVASERPILEISGLRMAGDGGRAGLRGLDLTVDAGEIVGIAGVAGSGQRELAEALSGAGSWSAGSIVVNGYALPRADPIVALRAGVSTVPEDPIAEWVVPGLSIVENMALAAMKRSGGAVTVAGGPRRPRLGMDWGHHHRHATTADEHAQLRMASIDREVITLSGGNIQRVVLTHVLAGSASVYVLCYPNRGLDIASCRQVHELMLARRAEGAAVILISEDLDELRQLSDRIAVLHDGHLAGFAGPEASASEIGELMLGGASGGELEEVVAA
jgi:simple sugar transport system ATP-binding protein